MTAITDYPTKKAFKAAVETGQCQFVSNPTPWGQDTIRLTAIAPGDSIAVTNHPKRSWFALVKVVGGKVVIK